MTHDKDNTYNNNNNKLLKILKSICFSVLEMNGHFYVTYVRKLIPVDVLSSSISSNFTNI